MSQENVEIVRSVYEAANRGDRERILGFMHPELVIDATRRVFNPTTYVGADGAWRLFADMDEIWEEFGLELVELIDAGDRVVVFGRLVGKGRASGVKVEQPIAGIWTVRDGRVVRVELGYPDRDQALQAEVRYEPEEFLDLGERVLIVLRLIGRGTHSGAPVDQRICQLWTLRNGVVVCLESFFILAHALEAAGLSQDDGFSSWLEPRS